MAPQTVSIYYIVASCEVISSLYVDLGGAIPIKHPLQGEVGYHLRTPAESMLLSPGLTQTVSGLVLKQKTSDVPHINSVEELIQ